MKYRFIDIVVGMIVISISMIIFYNIHLGMMNNQYTKGYENGYNIATKDVSIKCDNTIHGILNMECDIVYELIIDEK